MCSIGMVAMGVGTAFQAYSAYRGARAQSDASAYNANVEQANAQIARNRAVDARERGRYEVQQHKLRVHRFAGQQRAAFAGGGVAVDEGSPMDVLENTAYLAAVDEETIRNNAEREAYDFELDAYSATQRGELLSRQAASQRRAAPLLALGTIAGGVGRMVGGI